MNFLDSPFHPLDFYSEISPTCCVYLFIGLTQVQQLMEQKTHLLELQGRIQVELKNSQKDSRSFQEQRAALQKRLQEVGEMVELLTVDKELAEERAEALLVELSSSRDKVEELSLDLEILQVRRG